MAPTRFLLPTLAASILLFAVSACTEDPVSIGSDPTGGDGATGGTAAEVPETGGTAAEVPETGGAATGGRATSGTTSGGSTSGGTAAGGTDPEVDPSPGRCKVGGCSGQLCVEPDDDGISTCEWTDAYACYTDATCARQADGACAWTMTDALAACLANPGGEPFEPGLTCATVLCIEGTTCVEERICDAAGVCTTTPACVRLPDPELSCASVLCIEGTTCVEERTCDAAGVCATTPVCVPPSEAAPPCFIAGCSRELCTSSPDVASDCVYRPEYACYESVGECMIQADGACGWSPTPELIECLASSR
jgi:hypothetical protein